MVKQFVLLLSISLPLICQAGTREHCVVLALTGAVEYRRSNETGWQQLGSGGILQDRDVIRTAKASGVEISTYDGSVFSLPALAQLEIRDLKRLNRNDVVMELTRLQLLRLPGKHQVPHQDQAAFVLHGSRPQDDDAEQPSGYISRETNGALALFEQEYLSGFILKWNRLKSNFPGARSSAVEKALIEAYRRMEMPFRMQQSMAESDSEVTPAIK